MTAVSHTHTHTHKHARTHARTHPLKCTSRHKKEILAAVCACTHARTHARTHAHTHARTHTHTPVTISFFVLAVHLGCNDTLVLLTREKELYHIAYVCLGTSRDMTLSPRTLPICPWQSAPAGLCVVIFIDCRFLWLITGCLRHAIFPSMQCQ